MTVPAPLLGTWGCGGGVVGSGAGAASVTVLRVGGFPRCLPLGVWAIRDVVTARITVIRKIVLRLAGIEASLEGEWIHYPSNNESRGKKSQEHKYTVLNLISGCALGDDRKDDAHEKSEDN